MEEVKSTEVVTFSRDLGELTFRDSESVAEFIAAVERRNNAIEQITTAALKKLMPKDFVDMGGKPFLQGVGAERLKKYFGIRVTNVRRVPEVGYETVAEDDAGRLRVTYLAEYHLGDMVELGVGMRDTHNNFLCKKNSDYKALSEINLPDLDQAARTAMERDGISRLLGLRGLTWEYLEGIGFKRGEGGSVTYSRGAEGGNASGGDSDAQRMQAEIREWILEMAGGDKEIAKDILQNYTKNPEKGYAGYREVAKLTPASLKFNHPRVKKDHADFVAKMAGETPE